MAATGYSRGWIYEASLGIQPFRTRIPRRSALPKYRLWPSAEWCRTSDGCGKSYSSHPLMADYGMVVKWLTGWVNSRVKKSVVCIGWEYLKSMKFRLRVPRPEHKESNILEQEEWKKKSASVRLENQEGEPRKRRRSLVNGRTSARIETCFEAGMGGWV